MKKIIIRVLIGLIILGMAAVLITGLFLGSIVKKGLEGLGPKITGVDIKVEAVYIGVLSGTGTIKGLVVGNPEGYSAREAISIGEMDIAINPRSIFSEKAVIRSIRIKSPEITYEGIGKKNNLTRILGNVKANAKIKDKEKETDKSAQGKRIQVDDLFITDAEIHIINQSLTIDDLPDIHMTALGSGPQGITAGELTKRVLEDLETAVLKAVAGALIDMGKDAVGSAGKGAIDGITGIFKNKKK